jgi:hypothetical protein
MKSDEQKLTNVQYAEVIRSLIDHESEVTNHRMIWMAAFHGLLFTALGFAWDKPDTRSLITVFCLLGIAVSSLNAIALISSSIATRRLLIWWDNHKPTDYNGPEVIALAPKNPRSLLFLIAPWNILALIFGFGWVAILLINLGRCL